MSGPVPCDHPFCEGDVFRIGRCVHTSTASDQVKRLREFDADQLREVIAWPKCPRSTRRAAESRLRRLQREAAR